MRLENVIDEEPLYALICQTLRWQNTKDTAGRNEACETPSLRHGAANPPGTILKIQAKRNTNSKTGRF